MERRLKPHSARPAPTQACTIHNVPSTVLGKIFALAGKEQAPAMRLVCKLWDAAVLSEPAFWRSFALTRPPAKTAAPQQRDWISGKLHLLRRVADWVVELHVTDWSVVQNAAAAAGVCLEDFVCALHPDSARAVSLASSGPLPATVFQRLIALAELTALQLCVPSGMLPPSVWTTLGALRQLRSLGLSLLELRADLAAGLLSLAQLTKLDCSVSEIAQQVPLQRMSALSALRQLTVRQVAGQARVDFREPLAPAEMPLPAAFPHLTRYTFAAATQDIKVGGARLSRCSYAVGAHPSSPGRRVGCLDVLRISELPSLQDLLASLLPPGQPLSYLGLDHCLLPAGALRSCPLLASLPALLFNSCTDEDGSVTPPLDSLLRQAAALEALSCVGVLGTTGGFFGDPVMPASLVAKTGIKKLSLHQNRLEHLPPGPYLAGLELLDVGGENLGGMLPPSLTTAAHLSELVLNKSNRMRVGLQDVRGVLARMPSLVRLQVSSASLTPGVAKRVAQDLPHVDVVQA